MYCRAFSCHALQVEDCVSTPYSVYTSLNVTLINNCCVLGVSLPGNCNRALSCLNFSQFLTCLNFPQLQKCQAWCLYVFTNNYDKVSGFLDDRVLFNKSFALSLTKYSIECHYDKFCKSVCYFIETIHHKLRDISTLSACLSALGLVTR
jgi:hypothetical protein